MFQKGLFIDEPKVNLEMRRQGIVHESVKVKNVSDVGTLIREHAYGVNNTSTGSNYTNNIYAITKVKAGDMIIPIQGWNSAGYEISRVISKTDATVNLPQYTLGDFVRNGYNYGYYPITILEDLDVLYIATNMNYLQLATWTRDSWFY